jgi:hypothetical protein
MFADDLNGDVVIALLDWSASFDTVDHSVPIE